MQKTFEIVHSVHEAYRGLAVKLARMTTLSDQWFRSHGYEPKTINPLSHGNKSAVDDYVAYVETFEAAERGAGRMLNSRVHAELDSRFAENDLSEITQKDLTVGVIDQACDVHKWLASFDIDHASRNDLLGFETECNEAVEAISAARARARTVRMRNNLAVAGQR